MNTWNEAPANTGAAAREMLRSTFSPTAPVNRQEVFAGRSEQLEELEDAISQRGQHAVIYGDRGVGKTSLGLVAREIAHGKGMFTSLITCDSSATFASVWKTVFQEFSLVHDDDTESDASHLLADRNELTPDDIRLAFRALSLSAPAVVFIDEYDTLLKESDRKLFANLIKILSDHGIEVTIVFIGVARDVSALIHDHASVQRVLGEVFMPRMTIEERADIVDRGLAAAGMTATAEAKRRISYLSQGMPTIVHRLGQQSGFAALERASAQVDVDDVDRAIPKVVQRNMESISTVYEQAVFTTRQRRPTLFKSVALACALAHADDKGYFTSGALRDPLRVITGQSYEIPAYSAHLNDFSNNRGPLLEKSGSGTYRYQFVNPLYAPYIVLRALDEGLIDHAKLAKLSV